MQLQSGQTGINYQVPFYEAPPDRTHCVQAGLKMVLKYFQPELEYTMEELDRITAKVEGHWTWGYAKALWLVKHGFDVIEMSLFDNWKFIRDGEKYLLGAYEKEWALAQIKYSDIVQERELAKKYVIDIKCKQTIPTLMDIETLLMQGYLVLCLINSCILHNKTGYIGHSVLIKGFDYKHLIMHDPGPPMQEEKFILREHFEKAWGYPNARVKYLTAIKQRES